MIDPEISCHLCRANSWRLYHDFSPFAVWRCRSCGLEILHPQPSLEELDRLYTAEYFIHQLQDQMPDTAEGIRREIGKRNHFIRWLYRNTGLTSGSLLEVGCATGFLLKALQTAGWDVTGIEISPDASAYARERMALDVRTGPADKITLANDRFDVIILLHTLEHLPDPAATLTLLREHLKDNGRLIVQVPNSSGMEARRQGKKWAGWRIPYHLYHFSPATLSRLLLHCGYRVLDKEYSLPAWEIELLRKFQKTLEPANANSRPVIIFPQRKTLRERLLKWNRSLPIGRDVTCIAAKE